MIFKIQKTFKITQAFSNEETVQTLFLSLCFNTCNDQDLQKINPFEEIISSVNPCKTVTLFFDMCFSTCAIAIGIFQAIENVKSINEIALENCTTLGVGNTIVFIGQHNSLIAKRIKKQNCNLMGFF